MIFVDQPVKTLSAHHRTPAPPSSPMLVRPTAVLAFCGDGATSTGLWHESLNMAADLRARTNAMKSPPSGTSPTMLA